MLTNRAVFEEDSSPIPSVIGVGRHDDPRGAVVTPAVLVKAMLLNRATSGASQRAIDPTLLDRFDARGRRTAEPLEDPLMRKFPVGRWAVYFGLLPDVEYSVENSRTYGQWAGVTGS